MSAATDLAKGYEPPLQEVLKSDLTALIGRSDGIAEGYVEQISRQAANALKARSGGWSR